MRGVGTWTISPPAHRKTPRGWFVGGEISEMGGAAAALTSATWDADFSLGAAGSEMACARVVPAAIRRAAARTPRRSPPSPARLPCDWIGRPETAPACAPPRAEPCARRARVAPAAGAAETAPIKAEVDAILASERVSREMNCVAVRASTIRQLFCYLLNGCRCVFIGQLWVGNPAHATADPMGVQTAMARSAVWHWYPPSDQRRVELWIYIRDSQYYPCSQRNAPASVVLPSVGSGGRGRDGGVREASLPGAKGSA